MFHFVVFFRLSSVLFASHNVNLKEGKGYENATIYIIIHSAEICLMLTPRTREIASLMSRVTVFRSCTCVLQHVR
jgi:hypothetical protein